MDGICGAYKNKNKSLFSDLFYFVKTEIDVKPLVDVSD